MTSTIGKAIKASPSQDDIATMLSRPDEANVSLNINGLDIVLNAYDSLELGGQSGLSSDWTVLQLALFAEDITLAKSFTFSNLSSAPKVIISAHSITFASGTNIDISGAPGQTALPTPAGGGSTAQNQSTNGIDGGVLSLYLEEVDLTTPMSILANGGEGGGGQPGSAAVAGGDGKDGGAGGTVNALLSYSVLSWIDSLQSIYAMTDPGSQQDALKKLVTDIPSQTSTSHIISSLNAAISCKTTSDINSALEPIADAMQNMVTDWQNIYRAMTTVNGGLPGPYGVGTPNGSTGNPGSDGVSNLMLFGEPSDLIAAASNPFFFVHPSQISMLLEKAKLAYQFLDPVTNSEAIGDVVALFDRIRRRTAPFVNLDPQSSLALYYANNESDYGCIGAVQTLASLNAQASGYLSALQNGLDFYGYRSDYVPLTSLNAITKDAVVPLLKSLAIIEKAYNNQYKNLKADFDNTANAAAARDQINQQYLQIQIDISPLVQSIASHAAIIGAYSDVIERKLKTVTDDVDKFIDQMPDLGLTMTWKDAISALGQIAFAPTEALQYVAQATSLGYSGYTTVTDVQGQPVERSYIIHQLRNVESKLDKIGEAYTTLSDGTISPDDPDCAKLIAVQDDFEQMMDNYYGDFDKIPVKNTLTADFKDYIQTVTARNNQILAYNAAITMVLQYTQAQSALQQQAAALQESTLAQYSNAIPGLCSFISNAYYSMRQIVLRYMSLAARAYRFWCLTDTNLLTVNLGNRTPPALTSDVLSYIQDSFWTSYSENLGAIGNAANFPTNDKDEGEYFRLDDYRVDLFKRTGQAIFTIPISMKGNVTGPFVDMAAVRVTDVRVYLPGLKMSADAAGKKIYSVDVTHTGNESIVSPRNEVFHFCHEAITHTFKFDTIEQSIYQPASFQIAAINDPVKSGDLALIGPFTTWNIQINLKTPGLDLSALTHIDIYFRGLSWSFDRM